MQLEREFEEYHWVVNRSGFGPNGETTDEVWEQLITEKKEVARWRYTRFPYYDDMLHYYDSDGSTRPRVNHLIDGHTGDLMSPPVETGGEARFNESDVVVVGSKRLLDNAKTQNAKRRKRTSDAEA